MKKLFAFSFLFASLAFASNVSAYHLEFSAWGDFYSNQSTEQEIWFHMYTDIVHADAYYDAYLYDEDPMSGEVTVYPNLWVSPGYDALRSGTIEFMIVSDYGNTTPQPVNTYIDVSMDAWAFIEMGAYFDTIADSGAFIDSPGIGIIDIYADPWSFGGNDWFESSGFYDLMSNTPYMITADLHAFADIMAVYLPPESFRSIDDYNDFFFMNPIEDFAMADAEASLSYYLYPATIENPVPIPAGLWLLGSGLVGVAAIRKRIFG